MSDDAQERRDSISNDLLDEAGDPTVVPDADDSALLDNDPSLVDGEISLLDKDDSVQIDDPVGLILSQTLLLIYLRFL